ncbi:MAG: hypothetical protein LBU50_06080, partial [Cellulomonas sp.]|nr:hypothetical protein [Cellulomonas sp.]
MRRRSTRRFSRSILVVASLALAALFCAACSPRPYGDHDLEEINDIALQSGMFYAAEIDVDAPGYPWEHELVVEATLS